MMSMNSLGSLFLAVFSIVTIGSVSSESVVVDSNSGSICKTYYLVSGDDFDISYYGVHLDSECKIEIYSVSNNDLCVNVEHFEISLACYVTLNYYKGYSQTIPDETYNCRSSRPISKWCPKESRIEIGISKSGWGSLIGNEIHLKVTQKDSSSDFAEIAGSVIRITYVIIGCVIGGIVLISIIIIVIICCVCNKRRNTRGQVIGNTQQAPNQVPIGSYPTAATYPQPGPYPQAGYQPTALQPQQGYGNQHAPPDYKTASAPPNEPPPYSEN